MRLFLHALAWLILAQCLSLDGWSGMAANRKLTEADRKVWPLFEAATSSYRVLGEVQAAANPSSDEFEYGAALGLGALLWN